MTFFRVAQAIVRPLIWLYFRMHVYGRENLPKTGAYILVGNHRRLVDPVVAGITARTPVRFMAKSELFDVPVLRRLLRWLGVIPLHRGTADVRAIREALDALKGGTAVGLFPEGTRVKDEVLELSAIKGGVSLIALKAKATVIPLYNDGPYRFFGGMRVQIGQPISLAEFEGLRGGQAVDGASEKIRRGLLEARETLHTGLRKSG